MVATSADIHSIDTPSPLPTPGYLPLLSEASTPLTPATLHATSHSPSPVPANSPRISFRSFTLPLEIDDERSSNSANKLTETGASSSEKSPDPANHRLSSNLEERDRGIESCEGIATYDGCADRKRTMSNSDSKKQTSQSGAVFNDTEMVSCDNGLSAGRRETSSGIVRKDTDRLSSRPTTEISSKSFHEDKEAASGAKERDETTDSQNNLSAVREADLPRSNTTADLDSPMSCEQTLQELQESGFVICDSTDKVFTNTETQRVVGNTNDSGDWVIIGRTTGSMTTPISEPTSPNDSFMESGVNSTVDMTHLRPTSDNISGASLDLALTSTVDAFRLDVGDSAPKSRARESEEMILDIADTKESASCQRENRGKADRTQTSSFDLVNESNLVDDDLENESHARLRDRENGNRYSCDTTTANINSSQETNNLTREQQIRACYAEADNANVFGRNQNEACEKKEAFRDTFESYHRLSSRDTSLRRVGHSRLSSGKTDEDKETNRTTRDDRDNNEHCSNGLSEKCQSFGYNNSQKTQQTDSQQRNKCTPSKRSDKSESHNKCVNLQANQSSNVEVRIPSENAAEPCEVAHAPEGASETMERTIDTSGTFSSASSPSADDEAIVLRDTATILQELALQRLSGGAVADLSSARRRYENETNRDRRSFDSEIGREIVRERKMRQELDCARGKSEEPSQHLPPCLRARHARATRAALSRSLDEAKFNRMTGEIALSVKQTSAEDTQHCSTPNVGSGSGASSNASSEKIQLKNLGGLDLGDPQCRERIEKYKEERRTFLRDKYRSESFRGIPSKTEDEDGEQALLNRLKQRASRPSLH